MTDRELLQMALDALDIFYEEYGWGKNQQKAHEALRARLAEPPKDLELPLVRLEEFLTMVKGSEGCRGRPVMRTEWPTEEKPWVKTYSGGKPNYTQPEQVAQFKFQEYGPPNWGESQVTKPEFVAEQEAMNEALRKRVMDGIPDMPIKVQDEREENYKSFAQSAQVLGAQYDPRRSPSGSWTSWDNTMCNPLANARMQTQSAWQDGYDSAKAELAGTEPVAWMNPKEESDGYAFSFKQQGVFTVPLYTAPPQREWVGLTDEEIQAVHYELKVQMQGAIGTIGMYRMLERALREKNNG